MSIGSRWSRFGRDERGSGTLELAIVFPVVLMLIFVIVQTALFYHARNVALAAAQEGVRAATAFQGQGRAGVNEADRFLATSGRGALVNASVSQGRVNRQVTVTVSGTAPAVVPGFRLDVKQTATGPQERFTR